MMRLLDNTWFLMTVALSIILNCSLISYILNLKNRIRTLQKDTIKLRISADRDGLTGLYNRAAGERLLHKILNRKKKQSFGVLFLDLDHFKVINDTFGHLIGDQALQAMIQSCLPQLRKDDVFVRWGGEEFVVIVRGADQINLMALAERLRAEVAKIKIKGNISITASLGVTVSSLDDTVESLISRADQALYQAKRSGRNQIYFT